MTEKLFGYVFDSECYINATIINWLCVTDYYWYVIMIFCRIAHHWCMAINLFVFLNLFKTFHIPWERVSVDMAVWGQFWLVPTGWPLWTWPGLVWDKKVWLASVSIHLPPCANSTSVGVEKTSQTKVIPIYKVFKFCRTISYTLGIQLALVIVRVDLTCIYTRTTETKHAKKLLHTGSKIWWHWK